MRTALGRVRFGLDHRWASVRLSGYVDGELGALARRRLAHHLSECHDCGVLLGSLQQLLGALGRAALLDGAEPAPQIAVAVLARLDEPA